MTMSLERIKDAAILLALLVATAAIIFLSGGCYVVDPGRQTAIGLGQKKVYRWNEQGAIEVIGEGPQEEAFIMGEGIIELNEDGTINIEQSHLTHYLKSEPSADEAAQTMAAIMLANIEQSKQLNQFADRLLSTMEQVLPLLPDLIASSNTQPSEGDDTNARAELLERLLKLLEERGGGG